MGYGLTWRLLARGDEVTHFHRGTHPDPFGVRVTRLVGDRRGGDFARLLAGRSFDAAVDFAAFEAGDVESAVATLEGRVGHYVLISTGQVYLVREGCPWPASETDYEGALMPRPADPREGSEWDYGTRKRDCEDALARAFAERRFASTRLRIPMVDGERDHLRRFEAYLWRILDGGPVLVPEGDLRPVRHVYAGAVVRAIADLLGRADTHGQAYNLSQDEMPALPELVGVMAEALGARPRVVPVPTARLAEAGLDLRSVSPFSSRWMSCLEPARAKKELAFRHEPLREYVARIVASFLAHPPADPPPTYAASRPGELELAARLA